MRNARVNVEKMKILQIPCVTLKEATIKIAQYIPNNHAQSPQSSTNRTLGFRALF